MATARGVKAVTNPGVPTINDIAIAAGVSNSTVSRALSHPERVTPRTRERIQRLAADLKYTPRHSEPLQNRNNTGLVAVVVPEIADPFFLNIIGETQTQLKAAGFGQLLLDTEDSVEVEQGSLEKLRKTTDGVILVASRLGDNELRAAAASMPLVAINRKTAGVPCVLIDTTTGMVQALEHLVSLGHSQIGYIAGPLTSWSSESRFQALKRRSVELDVSVTKIGAFQARIASGAAAADMAINCKVTACICFGDLIAIGMLQRLQERGINVPMEFSVVGCDDTFGSTFCNPPLTTLTSPIDRLARVATRMLLNQMGPPTKAVTDEAVTLPAYLTMRESTGRNAAADSIADSTESFGGDSLIADPEAVD